MPAAARATVPLLTSLRALLPTRSLSLAQTIALTTRLAAAVRIDIDVQTDQLPTSVLTSLASVHVDEQPLPLPAVTYWDRAQRRWVVCLDSADAEAAQRFSLAHELAHIIWHGHESLLFPHVSRQEQEFLAEHAADLFAAELLIPRERVTKAYSWGVTEPDQLAERFGVTTDAVIWKLAQMDLPFQSSDDIDGPIATTDRPRLRPLVEDPS